MRTGLMGPATLFFVATQPVTYKWLAREAGIPYDTAKGLLFDFLTEHRSVGRLIGEGT